MIEILVVYTNDWDFGCINKPTHSHHVSLNIVHIQIMKSYKSCCPCGVSISQEDKGVCNTCLRKRCCASCGTSLKRGLQNTPLGFCLECRPYVEGTCACAKEECKQETIYKCDACEQFKCTRHSGKLPIAFKNKTRAVICFDCLDKQLHPLLAQKWHWIKSCNFNNAITIILTTSYLYINLFAILPFCKLWRHTSLVAHVA